MMEQADHQQKAAENLMGQFVDAGFVRQDEEGNFVIPGASGEKKFKPFVKE